MLPSTNSGFPKHFWFRLAVGLTFFTFLLGLGVFLVDFEQNPTLSFPLLYLKRLSHLDSQVGRNFFSQVIPGFTRYRFEDDPDFILETKSADLLLRFLINLRNPSPREMFKSQFPLLSYIKVEEKVKLTPAASRPLPTHRTLPETRIVPPAPRPPEDQILPDPRLEEKVRVIIYHTHTSESYVPMSGETHLHNGRGDIVEVGKALATLLHEVYGIKTIHCDTIHDYYPFREAYKRSEETVRQLLKENPQVEVVLDLHRDATPGLDHRVNINGKTAAKLILVVGSERLGLEHPHWEKNHQFARSLLEVMDRLYPNLAHGIILAEARYNQHLHPQSIIVEIGDDKSTREEVFYSVQLFAEVLAAYLKISQTGYSM
ncbi:MAG: stage II sporulation protein P [Firmicutes bacterium]|nr:stage II sporulation protein P [Bacillota bacterium]